MWRMSFSTAAVMYGSTLMALPLILALLNTVGMGVAGGWVPPLALGAASVVAAVALLTGRTTVALPRNIHILLGLPILVVSAASLVGRQSLEAMVFGVSLEPGTVGSLLLFAIAILCGALVARTHALRSLDIFLGASAGGSAITLAYAAFIGWEHVSLMNNISLIMCGALIVAVLRADGTCGKVRLMYGACAFLFCALLLFAYDASAGSLAAATLLAMSPAVMWHNKIRHIPWSTIIVVLFLGGSLLLGMEGKYVAASPDVRPSLAATSNVIGTLYFQDIQSALLGVGPNRFHYAWEKHRVTELNATQFWQVTPRNGYSTATTFAVTMGMLGFLALFLIALSFTVLVVHGLLRLYREDDAEMSAYILPVVALALFTLAAMFTEVVEIPLFLISGLAIGMSVRALELAARIIRIDLSFGGSRLVAGFIAVVALAMCVLLLQTSLRPIIAESFHVRAVTLTAEGNADAPRYFERAARTWDTSRFDLEASRAFVERAHLAGIKGDIYSLRALVDKALSYAGSAIDSEPSNYEVWLYRSSIYAALISSEYPQAAENASADINQARMLAPIRPDIFYQQALLDLARGRKVDARIALENALDFKSDYAEARTLLDSLTSERSFNEI